MKINKKYLYGLTLAVSFLSAAVGIVSCTSRSDSEDGATFGKKIIVSDENFKSYFNNEEREFEKIYKYATLTMKYMTEIDAINTFLNDSVEVIAIGRELNKEELSILGKKNIHPVTNKVANDGVALITNNGLKSKKLTYEQLEKILKGEITTWNQIDASNPATEIELVFDKATSGTIKYLVNKFGTDKFTTLNSVSADSVSGVIDRVSKSANALGFLSVGYVYDSKDTTYQTFTDKVRVQMVSPKGETEFYKPYQGNIAMKYYPLIRTVYMINREGRAGLGSGFVAFVAGAEGQKVLIKSGTVSATQNIRVHQQ